MTIASAIVDWSALAQAVYISVGVGLGLLLVAGLAVFSSLKGQDVKAAGNSGEAVAFNVVTGVCVIALVAAVVIGISVLAK
jgi:hypothetical protein